jgi:hypothetical protein
MNSKTTLGLVLAALAVFAWIAFVEAPARRADQTAGRHQPLLAEFDITRQHSIEMLHSNQLVRLERDGAEWWMTQPVRYRAHQARAVHLLATVGALAYRPALTPAELLERPQAAAEFGLDPPRATLKLHDNTGRRIELLLGNRSLLGDQLYFQRVGVPEILLGPAALGDHAVLSQGAWRDPTLVDLKDLAFNRVEVRAGPLSFTVQRQAGGQSWHIVKPPPVALADNARLQVLLDQVQDAQAQTLETAAGAIDLERLGLQPPELELVLGQGSNDVRLLQFGHSPTNAPEFVFARRQGETNALLVARELLDLLRVLPHTYRDRRLVICPWTDVDTVEVDGPQPFVVTRLTNAAWRITAPVDAPADAGLARAFLATLENTMVEKFVNDVVTDFAAYGLGATPPVRRYTFKSSRPRPGGGTNPVLATVEFGATQRDTIYARRAGENAVFAAGLADYLQLPGAWFELRDRAVWRFAASNVVSVTIEQRGASRKLLRNPDGEWSVAAPFEGTINPFSPELAVVELGRLRAERWIARTNTPPNWLGITDTAHRVRVEVRGTDGPQTFQLDIGRAGPRRIPYAAARLDGELTAFELPARVWEGIERDFVIPPLATP